MTEADWQHGCDPVGMIAHLRDRADDATHRRLVAGLARLLLDREDSRAARRLAAAFDGFAAGDLSRSVLDAELQRVGPGCKLIAVFGSPLCSESARGSLQDDVEEAARWVLWRALPLGVIAHDFDSLTGHLAAVEGTADAPLARQWAELVCRTVRGIAGNPFRPG